MKLADTDILLSRWTKIVIRENLVDNLKNKTYDNIIWAIRKITYLMSSVDRGSQFIGPGPESGEQEAARQSETAPQING